MTSDLDARLLAAHARQDAQALVTLYSEASQASQDLVQKRFYMTHAYVFALETGDSAAQKLRQDLVDLGAEPKD